MSFQVGEKVMYHTLDEEYYYRGYGVSMETKISKIVSVYYKLENGEIVEEQKLIRVDQEQSQSKSDPPKKD